MRILAMLTHPLTASSVLAATSCLAARSDPVEIDLIYPRPDTDPDLMPTEDVYTDVQRQGFEASQDLLVQHLSQEAANWAGAGLPGLRQIRGKPAAIAQTAAAEANFVVLGAPHGDFEANTILDALLFRANTPVLLVPRTMPRSFGQHIAIAWQGECAATERAVDSLDGLLLGAKRTIILVGDHKASSSPPPEVLLRRLDEADKRATVHHFPLDGRHIGEALLSEARQVKADLLVMGAFSHGRLREFIFGGATIEILRDFDLPVLMHH